MKKLLQIIRAVHFSGLRFEKAQLLLYLLDILPISLIRIKAAFLLLLFCVSIFSVIAKILSLFPFSLKRFS